jgi:hypothetical protein
MPNRSRNPTAAIAPGADDGLAVEGLYGIGQRQMDRDRYDAQLRAGQHHDGTTTAASQSAEKFGMTRIGKTGFV